jgi:hypothetical protein
MIKLGFWRAAGRAAALAGIAVGSLAVGVGAYVAADQAFLTRYTEDARIIAVRHVAGRHYVLRVALASGGGDLFPQDGPPEGWERVGSPVLAAFTVTRFSKVITVPTIYQREVD